MKISYKDILTAEEINLNVSKEFDDWVIIDIEQGSNEWLAMRRNFITSSDYSIINGSNKFSKNSPSKLWRQKLNIDDPEEENERMIEGRRLEIIIRDEYNKKNNTDFKPVVAVSKKYPHMMASLDGYDAKTDSIMEIKAGEKTYEKASEGHIASYNIDQSMHHLTTTSKQRCLFLVGGYNKDPIELSIESSEIESEKLIEQEKEFYDFLINTIPPPLSEAEFVEIRDEKTIELARRWRETKERLKVAEELEDIAKKMLLDETDDGNCIIPDAQIKIERRSKKGVINYLKLLQDLNIDKNIIEKYRKPEVSWIQPIMMKEEGGY